MRRALQQKRNYAGFTLREAMKLVPAEQLMPWRIPAGARLPSDYFREGLRRLEAFDLKSSEHRTKIASANWERLITDVRR